MEAVISIVITTGSFWIPFILGLMFLLFPLPDTPILRYYYKSKYLLSIAYLFFSALSLYVLIASPGFQINDTIRIYSPMIAIIQIIVFSYVNITLIKPEFLKLRRILRPVVPAAFLIAVYIFAFLHNRSSLFYQISYYTLFGFFAVLLVYYSVQFSKYYRQFRLQLDNYYSEVTSNHLRWVLHSQIIIVTSGVVTFFAAFIPASYMGLFLAVMILFFFYYAIRYILYGITFPSIEAIIDEKAAKETDVEKAENTSYSQLEEAIHRWENEKKFTGQSLTVENVATSLSTNRTYLSNYINTNKKKTFNEWINSLRVSEAKELMSKNPDIPIYEVSERVGFTDKSNFGRHFTRLTGNTPAAWRKEYSNETTNQ